MLTMVTGAKKKLNLTDGGASVSTLTYSSNKPGVASVTSAGIVTAVSAGIAVITITNTADGSVKTVSIGVSATAVGTHAYKSYLGAVSVAMTALNNFVGGTASGTTPVDGAANVATFYNPQDIVYNAKHDKLYLCDFIKGIRSIDPTTGVTATVYNNPSAYQYTVIATDGADMLYVGYQVDASTMEITSYNLATNTAAVFVNFSLFPTNTPIGGMQIAGNNLYMGIFSINKIYSFNLTTPTPVLAVTASTSFSTASYKGKLLFSAGNIVKSYDAVNGIQTFYTFPGAAGTNAIKHMTVDTDGVLYIQVNNNTDSKDYIYSYSDITQTTTQVFSITEGATDSRGIAIDSKKNFFESYVKAGVLVGIRKSA